MPTLYVLQPAKANFGIVLAPTHDLHQVVLFVLGNCTVVQVGSARVAVTLASNEIRMHFRTCQHFPHSIFRSHAATDSTCPERTSEVQTATKVATRK